MRQVAEGLLGGFLQVGENDLVLRVADPGNRLVTAEVLDAAGKRIDPQATTTTTGLRVLKFGSPLPADARVRILFTTPRSVVTVPLLLRDVALP